MSRKLWINPGRLKHIQATLDVGGVPLVVGLSMTEIPQELSWQFDLRNRRLEINFRYIDREPASPTLTTYQGIGIREGRYSRKVMGISIPVSSGPKDIEEFLALRSKALIALRDRRNEFEPPSREDTIETLNQDVIEEILCQENLFEEIASEWLSIR